MALSLIPSTASASECLTDEAVARLLEKRCTPAEAAHLRQHARTCTDCAELIGSAMHDGSPPLKATPSELSTLWLPEAYGQKLMEGQQGGILPAPALTKSLARNERVDHYRVVRQLGRGGMGEVYLAEDTELEREVALKVIRDDVFASKKGRERFLFEAKATARFSHPNIVTIHGAGNHRDRPYLALEYVEGRNLRETLRHRRLSLVEAIDIGIAITSALGEAHRRGILHRDLKPANILLGGDGRTRVLDFGLAQSMAESEIDSEVADPGSEKSGIRAAAATGTRIPGTPAYLPPEQWRGKPATPATDMWALGMILAELVGGKRPYEDLTLRGIYKQATSRSAVPLDLPADVPEPLRELIAQCLEKNPKQRPTLERAQRVLQQLQLSSHSSATVVLQRKKAGTGKMLPWIAGVCCALIVLAFFLTKLRRQEVSAPSQPALTTGGAHPAQPSEKRTRANETTTPGLVAAKDSSASLSQASPPPQSTRSKKKRVAWRRRASRRRHRRTRQVATKVHAQGVKAKVPATETGTLYVYTKKDKGSEQWARLYVDGVFRGDTPVVVRDLAVGAHRLRIVQQGFSTVEKDVTVRADKTAKVQLTLSAAP